ncbi:MAG: hypothetical protein LBH20_00600 [Treponema sp.]|jgi:hypothetical protein|nr:hypothetical protein [Treponema sp.]
MKKIITMIIAGLLAAGSAFALDDIIELSGEIKTGFFFEQRELEGETYSRSALYNNDGDSGPSGSRMRLGIAMHTKGIGLRTRFSQQNFSYRPGGINDSSAKAIIGVDFAYIYGNLFNSQLKISAGLLGESPWGTGGPELGRELETTGIGEPITGIRVEWKPIIGSFRGLNLGFVLNRQDDTMPDDAKEIFGDLFLESILGIAYEHQYFAFRFAYRFDRGIDSPAAIVIGEKLVYRIEERLLWRLLPGMSIWANGYCEGINAAGKGSGRGIPGFIQNWFYVSYDPEYFTTGVNVGYRDGFVLNDQRLEFRPYFYYKVISDFLVAGLMGGMEIGYNNGKSIPDAFYNFWFLEPQVKVKINNNLNMALVYRYTSGAYDTETSYKDQNTHWVNLRMCFTF